MIESFSPYKIDPEELKRMADDEPWMLGGETDLLGTYEYDGPVASGTQNGQDYQGLYVGDRAAAFEDLHDQQESLDYLRLTE